MKLNARTESTLMSMAIATAALSAQAETTPAVRTADFLNSIGIVTTFPDRGQPIGKIFLACQRGGEHQ
jgi:hypothetical protein